VNFAIRQNHNIRWTTVCAAMLALCAGCSRGDRPALAPVHGKVTLNGKPLVHAMVVFHPTAGARESHGTTNEEGEYELNYLRETMGGAVGSNTVLITKHLTPDPASQIIPARYNTASILICEVIPGGNNFPFDLTSSH